jgi:hypothetical protein
VMDCVRDHCGKSLMIAKESETLDNSKILPIVVLSTGG